MKTRRVHNTGQPLLGPDNSVLRNTKITFTIVDEYWAPIDVFDIITREKIVGKTTARTDNNGIFSVNLWPNTRGDVASQYLVDIDFLGARQVAAVLEDSDDAIFYYDWLHLGQEVVPADYNTLERYLEGFRFRSSIVFTLFPLTDGNTSNSIRIPSERIVTDFSIVCSAAPPWEYTVEFYVDGSKVLDVPFSDAVTEYPLAQALTLSDKSIVHIVIVGTSSFIPRITVQANTLQRG
jgi:hypothetical protein